jgi:hypothetical protein
VGSCPGGTASNIVTYLAQADVTLSVLMTTASTLGAVVATPLLTHLLLGTLVPVDALGLLVSTLQVRGPLRTPGLPLGPLALGAGQLASGLQGWLGACRISALKVLALCAAAARAIQAGWTPCPLSPRTLLPRLCSVASARLPYTMRAYFCAFAGMQHCSCCLCSKPQASHPRIPCCAQVDCDPPTFFPCLVCKIRHPLRTLCSQVVLLPVFLGAALNQAFPAAVAALSPLCALSAGRLPPLALTCTPAWPQVCRPLRCLPLLLRCTSNSAFQPALGKSCSGMLKM